MNVLHELICLNNITSIDSIDQHRGLQSSVSTKANASSIDGGVVVWNLLVNSIICLISVISFSYVDRKGYLSHIYFSRGRLHPKRTPYYPPVKDRYWGSWILDTIDMMDKHIVDIIGLDALLFLRFHRLCFRLLFLCCLYGIAVLLPVNMRFENNDTAGLTKYSINNIPDDHHHLLWLHVFGAYLFTTWALLLIWQEYRIYVIYRHEWLKKKQKTIMIRFLPEHLRSESCLISFFDRLFPNKVEKVSIMTSLKPLKKLFDKRLNILNKLEHSLVEYGKTGKRPILKKYIRNNKNKNKDNELNDYLLDDVENNNEMEIDNNLIIEKIYDMNTENVLKPFTYNKLDEYIINDELETESKDNKTYSVNNYSINNNNNNNNQYLWDPSRISVSNRYGRLISSDFNEDEQNHNNIHNLNSISSENGLCKLYSIYYYDQILYYDKELEDIDERINEIRSEFKEWNEKYNMLQLNIRNKIHSYKDTIFGLANTIHESRRYQNKWHTYFMSFLHWPKSILFPSQNEALIHQNLDVVSSIKLDNKLLLNKNNQTNNLELINQISPTLKTNKQSKSRESNDSNDNKIFAWFDDNIFTKIFIEKQKLILRKLFGNSQRSTAFVTFKSPFTASLAAYAPLGPKAGYLLSERAPEKNEILWDNLNVQLTSVLFKKPASGFFTYFIVAFFTIPVTFISGLTSVDQLRDNSSFINNLVEDSELAAETLALLSPFLLLLLVSTIPPIFSGTMKNVFREVLSISESHVHVFKRYYFFLFVNVFLVLLLSSSLFNSVFDIVKHPNSLLTEIGNAIPQVTGFYINYIAIKTLSGLSMELLRGTAYCTGAIKRLFLSDDYTRFQKEKMMIGCRSISRSGGFYFGKWYAEHLLVFLLCFVYSTVAPLILPFGLAFFGGCQLVYKRNLIWYYEPEYDSGGIFWPYIYRGIVVAIIVGHITLMSMLLITLAYSQLTAVFILPVLTFIIGKYIDDKYSYISKSLPLEIGKDAQEEVLRQEYNNNNNNDNGNDDDKIETIDGQVNKNVNNETILSDEINDLDNSLNNNDEIIQPLFGDVLELPRMRWKDMENNKLRYEIAEKMELLIAKLKNEHKWDEQNVDPIKEENLLAQLLVQYKQNKV